MYRKVRCQQRLALGEIANKPENRCPSPRPPTESACNVQRCTGYDYDRAFMHNDVNNNNNNNVIKADNKQRFVQDPSERSVKLRIGGQATLFAGSKAKIRCPVKRFDKGLIRWSKKGERSMIGRSGRVFVTKKGFLRLKALSLDDSGIYTCHGKKKLD